MHFISLYLYGSYSNDKTQFIAPFNKITLKRLIAITVNLFLNF